MVTTPSQRAFVALVSLGALFSGLRLVSTVPSYLPLVNVSASIGWASIVVGAVGLLIALFSRARA